MTGPLWRSQRHHRNTAGNQKRNSKRIGQSSLVHTGSTTTKRDGPHMASLSGREDTWDNGEKRGRRGVHLESAHPLQEDWGPLCHTVMRMPPLHHLKGHLALHCSASNTKCTHTAFVNVPKHGYSHLFPHHGAVAAAAAEQTQTASDVHTSTVHALWVDVYFHYSPQTLGYFCISTYNHSIFVSFVDSVISLLLPYLFLIS